mmetsp:Transcript_21943/g.29335  ORF Transcript_21943/g.29335 Transcript_21943/m.29335 type:complete len:91 (-) Transcript_21943:166-438(-)
MVTTEIAYYASKTLERGSDTILPNHAVENQHMAGKDGNESSFDDSFSLDDRIFEQAKSHLVHILRSNPQGCSLRQLHEPLKAPAFLNRQG